MPRFYWDLKPAFAEKFFLSEIAKMGIIFWVFCSLSVSRTILPSEILATFFDSVMRVGFVATEADFVFFEWDVAAFFEGNLPFICLPFLLRLEGSRGK